MSQVVAVLPAPRTALGVRRHDRRRMPRCARGGTRAGSSAAGAGAPDLRSSGALRRAAASRARARVPCGTPPRRSREVVDVVGPIEQVQLDRAEPEADDVSDTRATAASERRADRAASREGGLPESGAAARGSGHRGPQRAGAPSGRDHSTSASGATPSGRNPSEVWRSDQRSRPWTPYASSRTRPADGSTRTSMKLW